MNTVIYINSKNQHLINVTIYEAIHPVSVLVICSATGVKQSFYKKFAQYMSEDNITVVTFDYAGIGGSLKTNIGNMKNSLYDWGKNDVGAVVDYCINAYPNLKLILLGHSIGGQLIGLTEKSLIAHKIIVVNAQSGYWGFWTGFQKTKMWFTWNVLFPSLISIFGYLPSKRISGMENLPKNVAKQWRNWCNSKNYLFDFLSADILFYDKITCDLISYSVEDDNYAPQKAVDWLTSKYDSANTNREHIMPKDYNQNSIGHFGLFRENCKDFFWIAVKNEIKKHSIKVYII